MKTAWEVRDIADTVPQYGLAYKDQYVVPDFIFDDPSKAQGLLDWLRPYIPEPDEWHVVRVVFDKEASDDDAN